MLESLRADGTKVCATYDALGNIASATDALGQITRLSHSGTGHLARMIQADGQVYRFVYDSDERLVHVLNPRLEKYEFEYDRADQIVREKTFDNRSLSYRYDRAGRIARVEHGEGEWREFSHDKLGNVIEDRGEDVQISFARDAIGQVQKAICQDLTGKVVTEIERDGFGRLIADIQDGRAIRHEYDARGRRSARVLPDGERTEYHYDESGHFAGVTHEGRRVSIARDALGRELARQSRGWKIECKYDAQDHLLSRKVIVPEPGSGVFKVVVQRRYAYDAKGRVTAIDSVHGGLTTYRHDQIDQLVEATCGALREVFEYDPAGSLSNILTDLGKVGKKVAWSLATGNQLKATDHAKYVNDGCGRRIQRIERTDGKDPREQPPRGDERVTTYGWDTKGRLREAVVPDGSRVRFTYDAFGRRARKEVLSAPVVPPSSLGGAAAIWPQVRRTVRFLWDGDVLCEEHDSAKPESSRKRVHVHEPGTFVPMLQAEQRQVFGVVNDHLGMPKELLGEQGELVWQMDHNPWGTPTKVRNGTSIVVESPFRLLGQYADAETGLCCTRFRYFESETGRWLSPDPLGWWGGTNTQGFGINPVLESDPYGLACNQKRVKQLLRDLRENGVVNLKGNGISVEMLAALSIAMNEQNAKNGNAPMQEIAVTHNRPVSAIVTVLSPPAIPR